MPDTNEFIRDNANRFWHPLAPRTVVQFLSDEPDSVVIDRPSSLEKWGVKDTGRAGVQEFVLFEDALAAAAEIVADASEESRASILGGLGISEEDWAFEISEDYLPDFDETLRCVHPCEHGVSDLEPECRRGYRG
jgi:hypothetical protein